MPTIGGIVVSTGAAAGQRRTLSSIIDQLARPIDAADSTVRAIAADAFREAVRTMNTKGNWPWEIQDEEIAITVNEKFSSLNNQVKQPLAMHLMNESGGSRDQPIIFQPYEVFIEKYTLDFTSEPRVYTIPNYFETGQVRWYPTPSANDIAKFTYYRVTPIPTSDNMPVEIPDYVTGTYMKLAWEEFLKLLPSSQRPFDISIATLAAEKAFRDISAHVTRPGDRSRHLNPLGGPG